MSETRQSYHQVVLVGEWKRERRGAQESMVAVRCSCGREMKMTRSRWQHSPPQRCLKCNTKRGAFNGYGRRQGS